MKIGILTHVLATNYGGILQNWALQQVLKDNGYDPVTIDYYYPLSLKVCALSFASRIIRRARGEKIPLRAWTWPHEDDIIAKNTKRFVKEYVSTTPKCKITRLSNSSTIGLDGYIVGSDQVWRAEGRPIAKFFLSDFVKLEVPKVAYAASFGTQCWNYSSRETKRCRNLAKLFSGISVRESDAVNLCRDNLNVDAKLVLDPTLLLTCNDYEELIRNSYTLPSLDKKSLMVYILDSSKEKDCIVDAMSQRLGLSISSVRAEKYFSEVGTAEIQRCIFPSIEDWLYGFKKADFVVTDSFHGTVFAIIFNKPFATIINEKRGASRIYSILGLLGLEDRMVSDSRDIDSVLYQDIDYEKINRLLQNMRVDSLNFLVQSLNIKQSQC